MRRVLVALLLAATFMAGCSSGGGGSDTGDEEPGAFQNVEVTSTTGAIRGIVVNEAIVPIPDVVVSLTNPALNATTDADGAFFFNNLEPGTYFLSAAKMGYKPSLQYSVDVVAGQEPPITKMQLLVDVASLPYANVQTWSAFLQCGSYVFVGSANPCFATGSDNVHDFPFDQGRIPSFAQGEVVWTGTQPAGNWLGFSIHDPNGPTGTESCYRVNSESPAILKTNQTLITKCWGAEPTLMTYKLFPGSDEGTPPVPTVLANQKYDVYVQYFYGFEPREDYSLAVEGPCDPYTVCYAGP